MSVCWGNFLMGNEIETGIDFANMNGLLSREECNKSMIEGAGILRVYIELVL